MAAAARAFRVAVRQAHLEGEIGAQKVRQVGTVGANDHVDFVFAQTQVIEQHVARAIAQHFVQCIP
jgi:uncharacterized protein (UPF0261 family)